MSTFTLSAKPLFLLALLSTFVMLGCTNENTPPSLEERQSQTLSSKNSPQEDPLNYSLKKGRAEVNRRHGAFDYNALQLSAMSASCGKTQERSYFQDLVGQFSDSQRLIYSFKYQGESVGNGTYNVFLLPNVPGYASLEAFKTDFDICSNAGRAYPTLVNKDWLFFTSSCLPQVNKKEDQVDGCLEIKNEVDSTFKLK